jgi:hypothetical protein
MFCFYFLLFLYLLFSPDVTPLVIGNGGCVEGHESFPTDLPDFVAYRDNQVSHNLILDSVIHLNVQDWGYGVIEVSDESTLHFEMRRADDNSVADEFTLIRYH